ncbi:MAG: HIP---CoA ligase [Mycobacterium sp.]|nr:HIP---CoA ligase [Mycobacterium sp.]
MITEQLRYDLRWRSAPAMAQEAARRFGDDTALVEGSRRPTFDELAADIRASTAAAIAAGIGHGDRVAIWAPNSATWLIVALGVQGAGAVLVPVNTRFKAGEAAHVLRTSSAQFLFTVNGFLGTDYESMLLDSGATLPDLRGVVVMDGPAIGQSTYTWSDYLRDGDRIPPAEVLAAIDSVGPDDVADIIFTSGTTGRPKGVLTTHGQNLRCFGVYTKAIGLRRGDRYLIVNPFFHCFGYKAGFLACLMRGSTILPVAVFDPGRIGELIAAHRITVLPGPPTLLQSLLEQDTETDLSSLRLTVTGAAEIPVELIRRLRTRGVFDTILTAYGLTEASGLVSVSKPDDPPEVIARWSGQVIEGVEVRIVGDRGEPLPAGELGEIMVRGFNVMREYLDDPAATAEAVDEYGWLHTGDLGIADAEGRLRIAGRKKDMYIVGGFNAYPAEIEDILLGHNRIARVAVIGVPDDRLGEVGEAFVVPSAGSELDAEEIVAWAKQRMANYKVPRRVHLLDSLPIGATGKVDKLRLSDWARDPKGVSLTG